MATKIYACGMNSFITLMMEFLATEGRLPNFARLAFMPEPTMPNGIWNALKRDGLKGVAVHYPVGHPSEATIGYVIYDFGSPFYRATDFEVTGAQPYTTVVPEASDVSISPTSGWANLPASHSSPLATASPGDWEQLGDGDIPN